MRRSSLLMLLFITVLTAVAGYVAWPGSRTLLNRRAEVVRGLDLQGGLQVLLQAAPAQGQTLSTQSMDDAREIVENRVNGLGVSEPVVQRQGADRIVVELPGVRDPQQAIDTFQSTGLLEFVDVGDAPVTPGQEIQTTLGGTAPTDSQASVATVGPNGTPPAITGASGTAAAAPTPAPDATAQPQPTTAAPPEAAGPVYRTVMTGAEIDQASAGIDPQTQQPVVQFKLTSEGARLFGDFTQANIGKQLAIVLDKRVVSAPTIQSAITGGEGVITGVD
ncbi:MAG: protein translocase subunit SecD, partial [Chloroflexota bacterium]|nr:protein translocase subunit SecD [Chloroflexota bacterium]